MLLYSFLCSYSLHYKFMYEYVVVEVFYSKLPGCDVTTTGVGRDGTVWGTLTLQNSLVSTSVLGTQIKIAKKNKNFISTANSDKVVLDMVSYVFLD